MRSKTAQKPADAAVLPSVDEILTGETAVELIAEFGRERIVGIVRSLVAERRKALLGAGPLDASIDRSTLVTELTEKMAGLAVIERRAGVRRVINATGVLIHTNLGRAPWPERAIAAVKETAAYSTIEYDLEKGSRGARGANVVNLVKLLTGAEDALAVNNCAAAALLVLSVFAQGREVIVSRGELVEIGGDFRIPDILARSGAVLREVGTTNRTHLRDYENAISDRTALILKVHPSNFRITGFTKIPGTAELIDLARKSDLIFYEDAGSGALVDLDGVGIKGEPVIREVLLCGADLVSFSGDKLLGGPQAGIIAGRAELIETLRRDPFYRALRLDKTITAALQATLESYARGSAEQEVPVLRMLSASKQAVTERSERFVQRVHSELAAGSGLSMRLDAAFSAVGGGAAPDAALETTVVAITHSELSEAELEQRLRNSTPPVITRIDAGRVLIDLLTVSESEETEIIQILSGMGGV